MKIEYNNLYTHFVFTTFRRLKIIPEKNRERIEKYITGIVNNNDSKMYTIYANPEHLHFLISKAPNISEQRIASVIANGSENFINDNNLAVSSNFSWQNTASAFSVSKDDVDKVCKYILNQAQHHKTVSFSEEYDAYIKFYQRTLNIDK